MKDVFVNRFGRTSATLAFAVFAALFGYELFAAGGMPSVQAVALIFGAACVWLTYRSARAFRATADERGLEVRMLLRTRRFEWATIDHLAAQVGMVGAFRRSVLVAVLQSGSVEAFGLSINCAPGRQGSASELDEFIAVANRFQGR